MKLPDLNSFVQLSIETVCQAGDAIDGFFGLTSLAKQTSTKLDETPVTVADYTSEKLIVSTFERYYPELGILSEEAGHLRKSEDTYLLVVDPLDGTSSFERGIPTYGILVALIDISQETNVVMTCVVHEPQTGRVWSAVRGEGAYLSKYNRYSKNMSSKFPICVSIDKEYPPEKSMLLMDAATKFRDVVPTVDQRIDIVSRTFPSFRRVRMIGSLALQFAYVASGFAEATVADAVGGPHDLCAHLLVDEAHGRTSDLNGEQINIFRTNVAIATNGSRHDILLSKLQGAYV